ncbi:MAG TPA: hypothetical protein VGD08_22630 [Stellaceae bacterium]|jgi:hypothetical protein
MSQDSKSNPGAAGGQQNEGEGNRTAARQYNKDQQNFVQSGKVDEKAKEARDALDGAEGKDLADAEAAGKGHAHGEDPQLKKG